MMRQKFLYWAVIFSILTLLTGCTTTRKNIYISYIPTETPPLKTDNQNAQDQLAEAATSVGHSLQEISAIQMATHPNTPLPPPLNPDLINMAQRTSIDWTGPIEPLLEKIAGISHYKLHIIGKKPAIPVLVTINLTDVPLAEILRNATYQAARKANIVLYPSSRTIELRYYAS